MPGSVIGNTAAFGAVFPGSSPGPGRHSGRDTQGNCPTKTRGELHCSPVALYSVPFHPQPVACRVLQEGVSLECLKAMASISEDEIQQLLRTVEMFEAITQSQPEDYQSWEILKEAYAKLGRRDESLAASKRLAKAHISLGQISQAILEYEGIL